MKLWYEQPARSWTEALPIGNGRFGAMVYGKTDKEIIPLNEDTLWSGYPRDLNPNDKRESFLKAVELSKDKKYHEAQELIEAELTFGWTQSYMPIVDLILNFNHTDISDFTRSLDISNSVAYVEYKANGAKYRREIFASAPDNLIIIKISCDRPMGISFSLGFDSQLRSTILAKDDCLILEAINEQIS